MNQTCDRCGPAVHAAYRVDRSGEFYLPSQPRAGRFADPQPIRDNAPAIDRLAAFTGRPVP